MHMRVGSKQLFARLEACCGVRFTCPNYVVLMSGSREVAWPNGQTGSQVACEPMAGAVKHLFKALEGIEDLQFAPVGFPKDFLTGGFLGSLGGLAWLEVLECTLFPSFSNMLYGILKCFFLHFLN